jgi:hypothetical protein
VQGFWTGDFRWEVVVVVVVVMVIVDVSSCILLRLSEICRFCVG